MVNPKIALKIAHTSRVAEISEKIAENLCLNSEDIDTAWIIGMLHDIGRFEQIRRFDTFEDAKSVNHADLGVEILFEENLIDIFEIDKSLYDTIRIAISNHNKYRITEGLSDKEF